MANIIAGQPIRYKNTPGFQDENGNPIDPETVTLKVKINDVVTTYELGDLVKDAVSLYHYDDVAVAAKYVVSWSSTNPTTYSNPEAKFTVDPANT